MRLRFVKRKKTCSVQQKIYFDKLNNSISINNENKFWTSIIIKIFPYGRMVNYLEKKIYEIMLHCT